MSKDNSKQRRPRVFEKWTHNEAFKYMGFFVLTMVKKYFNEKLLPQEKKLTHVSA